MVSPNTKYVLWHQKYPDTPQKTGGFVQSYNNALVDIELLVMLRSSVPKLKTHN